MVEAAAGNVQVNTSQSLRRPSMRLPSFRRDHEVRDDISEFLERFTQKTSNLPVATRLLLLEQQRVGEGQDLFYPSPNRPRDIRRNQQRNSSLFISICYVQSLASRKRINAAVSRKN